MVLSPFGRVPWVSSLTYLAAATTMLCLAKNLPLLIIGRLLQGASGGCIWVVGLALLADTVPKATVGQAMGYPLMGYSIASLLAPLLGGVVYERAGYYAVFAMAFGMIGLDLVLRILLIEKKVAKKWISSEESIQTSPTIEALDAEKALATTDINGPTLSTDVSTQQAQPKPELNLIPNKRLPPVLILLKSRRMQATFWVSTVDAMIITCFDVTLPLYVKETFHWTSVGGGLIFLALLCPSFIQPLFGWLIDKHGPRWPSSIGLLICIPSFICLRFVTHDSMAQKVLLCALIFVIGLGACLTIGACMAEFTYICAEKEERQPGSMGRGGAYAQSYGFFNVSWALGCLVGSYWAGGIRNKAGWGTMGWTYALLCAVVVVPSVLYIGGNLFQERKRKSEAQASGESRQV